MDGNNMNNEYTYAADSVYDAAPAPAGNGLAIAALICGIAGIICCPRWSCIYRSYRFRCNGQEEMR